MRCVFFSDLHINKKQSGPRHPSGYPQRVVDIQLNLKLVVDFAIEHKVDYLLFGGDAYETSKPLEEYRHMFRAEIVRAATNNIYCILIPGNHDMSKRETADHALAEFRDIPLPNIKLIDKPTLLEFDDMVLFALPWQYQPFTDPIILPPNKLKVCIAHCSVLGAIFDSGQTLTHLGRDFGIDLDFFKQFNLSFLGHIHAPQVLLEQPFVGYPGSSEWLTWGEFGAYHGWFYYDGATVKHIYYNHRSRFDLTFNKGDILPIVDPAAMYRITTNDVNCDIVRTHFKDCFDLTIIPINTNKLRRPDTLKISSEMTNREIIAAYVGKKRWAEIQDLFDEIENELAKN